MEKTQLKKLKHLSRSELLEVMLALKRENDILMVENARLKTIKHRLEHNLEEISETLRRIEGGTAVDEYPQDGAEAAYEGTADGSYTDMPPPPEESFESVFDGYADEVTNR